MLIDIVLKLKTYLWSKNLPLLAHRSKSKENPYSYYSVYFRDVNGIRYFLEDYSHNPIDGRYDGVLLETRNNKILKINLPKMIEMKTEIIHHRKYSSSSYKGIISFALDYYTKVLFLKRLISKAKGALLSFFVSETTSLSHDRYAILKLMLEEHLKLMPSRESNGFREADILNIIYGRLWYKHIRQEEYKLKLRLILDSLVITKDLSELEGVYFIQSKAVNTIVDHEKASSLKKEQVRIQKNIFRFIVVLTALLVIIVLVLLSLAGIVNLANIWSKITEIKPVRFLLGFI